MLQLEEALARILAVLPPASGEEVTLNEAHGRVLLQEAATRLDLPAFDNSAMDGYAVRAKDLAGAKAGSPVRLRLAGRVAAGENFDGQVLPGTCVRLFTGSALPPGADAVVMQEETRVEEDKPEEVLFLEKVGPWENIRFQGEDVKRGQALGAAGTVVTAGRLSLLAAAGCERVKVGRRPVVGLLATGSELREPGQELVRGQVYESNRLGLAALVRTAGGIPRIFPLVADVLKGTRAALAEAFAKCDIVVSSGGVSVGEMDFIKRAFAEVGGELQFWKVAIKPGRPFVFGRRESKYLFGLPGNPVSAFVTFLLLVRPALLRWQGATEVSLPAHLAILGDPLDNPGERRHFVRVKVDAEGKVYSAGTQASHVLISLASATGLVEVPPGTTLASGTPVKVMRWEG
jgi:molybdopterin molybdotransferase